jgi:integral membrane protein
MFVAMPLKYLLDMPTAVRIMGTVHGFLFVAYMYFLIESWAKLKWKFKTPLILFIMSLIPFGTFLQKKVIDWGEE